MDDQGVSLMFKMTAKDKWKIGDRVTRQIWLDDGTWRRLGDDCLQDSPLKHGTIIEFCPLRDDALWVKWDDGEIQRYLDHGVDKEMVKIEKTVEIESDELIKDLAKWLQDDDKIFDFIIKLEDEICSDDLAERLLKHFERLVSAIKFDKENNKLDKENK